MAHPRDAQAGCRGCLEARGISAEGTERLLGNAFRSAAEVTRQGFERDPKVAHRGGDGVLVLLANAGGAAEEIGPASIKRCETDYGLPCV